LLTGLTTFLFNHGLDNPLIQPTSTHFHQGEDNKKGSIYLKEWNQTQKIGRAQHGFGKYIYGFGSHSLFPT
jgi:hypothetical protein